MSDKDFDVSGWTSGTRPNKEAQKLIDDAANELKMHGIISKKTQEKLEKLNNDKAKIVIREDGKAVSIMSSTGNITTLSLYGNKYNWKKEDGEQCKEIENKAYFTFKNDNVISAKHKSELVELAKKSNITLLFTEDGKSVLVGSKNGGATAVDKNAIYIGRIDGHQFMGKNHSHDRDRWEATAQLFTEESGLVIQGRIFFPSAGEGKNSVTKMTDYELNNDKKSYSTTDYNNFSPILNTNRTVSVEEFSEDITKSILGIDKKQHTIHLEILDEKGHPTSVNYKEFCNALEKNEAIIHARGLKSNGVSNNQNTTLNNKPHNANSGLIIKGS